MGAALPHVRSQPRSLRPTYALYLGEESVLQIIIQCRPCSLSLSAVLSLPNPLQWKKSLRSLAIKLVKMQSIYVTPLPHTHTCSWAMRVITWWRQWRSGWEMSFLVPKASDSTTILVGSKFLPSAHVEWTVTVSFHKASAPFHLKKMSQILCFIQKSVYLLNKNDNTFHNLPHKWNTSNSEYFKSMKILIWKTQKQNKTTTKNMEHFIKHKNDPSKSRVS